MTGFEIIFEKTTILGLLALIGFASFKFKWLGSEVKNGLQKLIFNLTLPLLIFTTIAGFSFSDQLWANGIAVFLLTYPLLAMQYGLGWLVAKVFKLPEQKASVHILHTTFGNVVFLGYPLIHALFPDTHALFYAAVYHLAQMTVIWTYGVYRLDKSRATGLLSNLKKLINPSTLAFIAGFLLMILNIGLPPVIRQTFSGIGNSTLSLSMIYIGMLVAEFKPCRRDFGFDLVLLNLNKLIVAPVLAFMIISLLSVFSGLVLSHAAIGAVVMQTAMPCMAIMVILAKNYGADENAATLNVFSTTLLGLITLPLIYWFITTFSATSFFNL
jgi:malate permease and related proteins